MPLKSGIGHIGENIHEMEASGHSKRQAIAAALHTAYGPQKHAKGGIVGALSGATGGRADKLPIDVPDGSHVIPADVVAALGDGNTVSGFEVLSHLFPPGQAGKEKERSPHAGGGRSSSVPIAASDGEFVVSPEHVGRVGGGNAEHGHRILDHLILHTRKDYAEKLRNLPPPEK